VDSTYSNYNTKDASSNYGLFVHCGDAIKVPVPAAGALIRQEQTSPIYTTLSSYEHHEMTRNRFLALSAQSSSTPEAATGDKVV
jgi:hypothetical protein